jgi:hypothetical protein
MEHMAKWLTTCVFNNYNAELERDLVMLLGNKGIDVSALLHQCYQQILKKYQLLLAKSVNASLKARDDLLLQAMLKIAPIKGYPLECLLIMLRRQIYYY